MPIKRLYIVRHGKAEYPHFDKDDYTRNLTDNGMEKSHRIAREIAAQVTTDSTLHLLSSSANRAYQTAEIFSQIFDYPSHNIQQEKGIYEAYHLDILRVINQVPDQVDTLFVFGHNPGLSFLTGYLSKTAVELNTSNVAYLELEEGLTFADLSEATAHLKKVFE